MLQLEVEGDEIALGKVWKSTAPDTSKLVRARVMGYKPWAHPRRRQVRAHHRLEVRGGRLDRRSVTVTRLSEVRG